jgi:hypothetical protein
MGIGETLGFRVHSAIARLVASALPRNLFPELPRVLQPLAAEIARLDRLRDPRHVYMYCLACTLD